MSTGGQTSGSLEQFGTYELPRLVGVLTLCGYPTDDATRTVRRAVQQAVSGGLEGGRDASSWLAEQVLLDARPPRSPRPPADALDAALQALPWEDRLATVASVVPGTTRLGLGRPDEVAAAVGARTAQSAPDGGDHQPLLADVITDAVAAHAGEPVPELMSEARRTARRTGLRVAVIAVVAVAVLCVVGIVIAARAGSLERGRDAGGPGDGPITQWVAVLQNGPTPASLAGDARILGRTAGVYVFTDRWSCYEGFPEGLAVPGGWFLGLAANDKAVVDGLLAALGRTALAEARVQQVCVQQPPDGPGTVVVAP